MRLSGSMLRRLIAEELDRSLLERLIREAEGDEKADEGGDDAGAAADALFGGDEEGDTDAAADEGGDDASSDEGGGDDAAAEDDDEDAAGDDAGAEDGEEKKTDKEEDEEEPVEPTGPAGFEFDEEINQAMMGFEEKALQMGAAKGEVDPISAMKKEGRAHTLSYLLFEAEEEVQFDVPTFADDVARLISNYDTLIDMEQAIFTKAKDFLEQKYGKDAAVELEDILSRKYQLEFEDSDPEASEREVFAAGSTGAASA